MNEYINKKFVITIIIKEEKNFPEKIENATLDELYEALPYIDKDTIKLVYGYLHKGKLVSAYMYANHFHISESYLYKILKRVKEEYELLINNIRKG